MKTKKFSWLLWIALVLSAYLVAIYFTRQDTGPTEITWEQFRSDMLMRKDVAKLEVSNKEKVRVFIRTDSLKKKQYRKLVNGKHDLKGPQCYFTIGSLEVFEQRIEQAESGWRDSDRVDISFSNTNSYSDIFSWFLPVAILLLWYSFSRRMYGGGRSSDSVMEFSRSKAREYQKGKLSNVTFKQVAGYEEAKSEVMEIVEFLKSPQTFTRIGAKIPKGVLLVGPPGTGKTLMAKAVAGEAAVPFFSLSGSEFIELFVGVGASRVRDLFNRAKERAPSIVFIDEIDTIGRVRERSASVHVNDERESTLNQLLAEMDGFDANTGVIVLAATNRADILDPALLRAGRFDRHIYLELPNRKEREDIFRVHLKPLILDSRVDSNFLASQTPGFSGADIANVCNEAALIAARHRKEVVDAQDFSDAIDRVVGGLEKKTRIITASEKKIIAYHEAGHAIVSWVLPGIDPLVKVSIIPRGKSLGGAWFLPEERQIITKSKFVDRLSAALAGRAAEDIAFDEISSGALDDLEKATKQAYNMVVGLGMGIKVGNLSYHDSTGSFDSALQKPYSEAMARTIDEEVQAYISDAYKKAKEVLIRNRNQLDKIAGALLDKEVVYSDEIEVIMGKRAPASY